MSDGTLLPAKQDVANELRRIATTLSDDAQNAALRKCQELGFDTNRGRIALEETFINLSQAREILLDAVDKGKFVYLPLKLQYSLRDAAVWPPRETRSPWILKTRRSRPESSGFGDSLPISKEAPTVTRLCLSRSR
jgi:hypothetical protein